MEPDIKPLIEANSKFSIDLLKVLCKVNTKNVLFSPLSISSALGLVLLGAGGETSKQMYRTLHFDNIKIIYHDLYEALYKGGNHRSLKLVNRMFGERTLNFYGDFLDMCEEWCFGSLRNADFKTNPVAARDLINYWVKDKTGNQIENLLNKGDVTKDTSLVLISAVHFKNKWANSFTRVPVIKDKGLNWPMMSQTNTFPLGKILQQSSFTRARILEIPYDHKDPSNDLSMLIILPNKSEELPKLVDLITYEKLLEWTKPDNMIPTSVDVKIPIFKLQENYDLKNVLKTLGTTDLFDEKCDLSGMAPGPLNLPRVVHKSSVEVNEEGTDIGAGSDAVAQECLLSNKCVESFVADHPFLFFIRHNPTKSIIFWSRFTSPTPAN